MKNETKFALWFIGFWLCVVGMALMPMLEFRPIYLVEFFALLFGAVECIMQCLKHNK